MEAHASAGVVWCWHSCLGTPATEARQSNCSALQFSELAYPSNPCTFRPEIGVGSSSRPCRGYPSNFTAPADPLLDESWRGRRVARWANHRTVDGHPPPRALTGKAGPVRHQPDFLACLRPELPALRLREGEDCPRLEGSNLPAEPDGHRCQGFDHHGVSRSIISSSSPVAGSLSPFSPFSSFPIFMLFALSTSSIRP